MLVLQADASLQTDPPLLTVCGWGYVARMGKLRSRASGLAWSSGRTSEGIALASVSHFTPNRAELVAAIQALHFAFELQVIEVRLELDSEGVVAQINRPTLSAEQAKNKLLWDQFFSLREAFATVQAVKVHRDQLEECHRLAQRALRGTISAS